MYTFLPVGLLSLSASVRRGSHLPKLIDLNRAVRGGTISLSKDFYEESAKFILKDSPDVVGFMTECDSYHHILQICDALKSRMPSTRVVLGGPQASVVANETMLKWSSIDAIVVGEAELTFPALIDSFASDARSPVPGSVVRWDGEIVDGGPANLVDILDDLPFPDFHLYTPEPGEEVFLEVGRGCPFSCSFCSTAPFWKRRHRVKSPRRIIAEITLLRELHQIKRVHFTHDLFTTDRKWVELLCSALRDAGTVVRWTCSARIDTVTDDLLANMASAGCDSIYFGIESGSTSTLATIRKSIPLDETFHILHKCIDNNISPNAGFIVGLPGEDRQAISQTFVAYEKALRIGAKPTHIFGFCPFTGSSIFQQGLSLEHRGHYVDLPLGAEVEWQNRNLIGKFPDLFASYYRCSLASAADLSNLFIDGIDEFSPLVELALLPTLSLCEHLGGMIGVYDKWVAWISTKNADRGVSDLRKVYGRPEDYCQFLVEELALFAKEAPGMADVASILLKSQTVNRPNNTSVPTRIGTYRSFSTDTPYSAGLSNRLRAERVAGCLSVSHDVAPALIWKPGQEFPILRAGSRYFVWQFSEEGNIRLLSVDASAYELIKLVAARELTIGEVISERFNMGCVNPGYDETMEIVDRVVRNGLLSVEG